MPYGKTRFRAEVKAGRLWTPTAQKPSLEPLGALDQRISQCHLLFLEGPARFLPLCFLPHHHEGLVLALLLQNRYLMSDKRKKMITTNAPRTFFRQIKLSNMRRHKIVAKRHGTDQYLHFRRPDEQASLMITDAGQAGTEKCPKKQLHALHGKMFCRKM